MDKSKTRATDSRIDVRFPPEILAAIEAIAVANNAPTHHISKKPILTPTVIELVRLGLNQVSERYGLQLSDKVSDGLSGSLADGVGQRIDAIEGDVAELKKLMTELSDKLSANNPITSLVLEAEALKPSPDKHYDNLSDSESDNSDNLSVNKSDNLSDTAESISKNTTKFMLQEVAKFKDDPNFFESVKKAIAPGKSNADVVDLVFKSGYGANDNTKPFNLSYVARWRNAIAYIEQKP